MKETLNFRMLTMQEMECIIGGTEDRGLLGELAYVTGVAVRSMWEFSKAAMVYQSSLPANLKK